MKMESSKSFMKKFERKHTVLTYWLTWVVLTASCLLGGCDSGTQLSNDASTDPVVDMHAAVDGMTIAADAMSTADATAI